MSTMRTSGCRAPCATHLRRTGKGSCCEPDDALGLVASGVAGVVADRVVALRVDVAVGVAVDELRWVGVSGGDNDATEVVDGVVEREDRGLLAALSGGARGKASVA